VLGADVAAGEGAQAQRQGFRAARPGRAEDEQRAGVVGGDLGLSGSRRLSSWGGHDEH